MVHSTGFSRPFYYRPQSFCRTTSRGQLSYYNSDFSYQSESAFKHTNIGTRKRPDNNAMMHDAKQITR